MNKKCLINIVFILFLVLIGVIAYLMLRPGHIIGGDYSLYIRQAKCIVEGDAQLVAEDMKFMLANSSDDKFSPVLYPWGFPLLLSPLYYISGINFDLFKLYELFFYILGIVGVFLLFRSESNFVWQALFIALFIGLQPCYIFFLNLVLSEMPYFCFTMFSLYAIKYLCQSGKNMRWQFYAGLGVLLMFTAQIRTEGILLFVALGAKQGYEYYSLKKSGRLSRYQLRRFLLISATPYISGGMFFCLLNFWLPSGFMAHANHFELFSLERIVYNLKGYFDSFREFSPFYTNVTVVLFLLVSVAGIIRRFFCNLPEVVFLLCSIGLLLVWPHQNTRHLFVLFPLFCYFFMRGVELFIPVRYTLLGGISILALFCIVTLLLVFEMTTHRPKVAGNSYGVEKKETKELCQYVKEHIPYQDVVAFAHSRWLYLATGRRTVASWGTFQCTDAVAQWYIYCRQGGRYFQYTDQDIASYASSWKEMFRNEDYIIYQINGSNDN